MDLEAGELGHAAPEECGEDERPPPSTSSCGGGEGSEREENQGSQREEGGGGGGDIGGEERGGVVPPPDVVQRSHDLVHPDITNFLSVESRTRSHHGGGSRYSESNFRYACGVLIKVTNSN